MEVNSARGGNERYTTSYIRNRGHKDHPHPLAYGCNPPLREIFGEEET